MSAVANPFVLVEAFNKDTASNMLITVRLNRECVLPFIADIPTFDLFAISFQTLLAIDLDEESFKPLPLGPELSPQWLMCSQTSAEANPPPACWRFKERIEYALTNPETHPLILTSAYQPDVNLDDYVESIHRGVEQLFGPQMLDNIETRKSPSIFDPWELWESM